MTITSADICNCSCHGQSAQQHAHITPCCGTCPRCGLEMATRWHLATCQKTKARRASNG